MNGQPRREGPYKSQRPPAQGGRVVRLPSNMGRAVRVLSECDPLELSHAICSVISMGYVISFTGTGDGGAVSVTVYDGEVRYKAYGRDADQLCDSLHNLLGAIRGEE